LYSLRDKLTAFIQGHVPLLWCLRYDGIFPYRRLSPVPLQVHASTLFPHWRNYRAWSPSHRSMSFLAGSFSPMKRTKVWRHFLHFAHATPATPDGISNTSFWITRRFPPQP
jgi:hypothetical protein